MFKAFKLGGRLLLAMWVANLTTRLNAFYPANGLTLPIGFRLE